MRNVDLSAPLWQQAQCEQTQCEQTQCEQTQWQQADWPPQSPPADEQAQCPAGDLARTPVAGPRFTLVPGTMPRRERLLLPEDYLPQPPEPPGLGWRRVAWRAGARWMGPGPREQRHREWAQQIRRPIAAPKVIAVVSPKGGVGKSTTTALLGSALALVRGNQVTALDANPDSGNLAARLHDRPSMFGAQELHRDSPLVARYSDLVPYLTASDSGLCAVRSAPEADVRLGPAEYLGLLDLLRRFYSLIVVDLGTGIREPAFQAIIDAADAVVAVTGPGFDSAEVLMEGLDWLSRRFPGVFRTATGVINGVASSSRSQDVTQITAALKDWVADVVQVPADPHLAGGGVTHWPMLGRHTQDAYLELAATVVGALPEAPGWPGEDDLAPSAQPVPPARSAAWRLGAGQAGAGRPERTRARWRQLMSVPITSPKIVAVFSPRGGVGKTTTALHLGHALAMVRGDLIVALDANPDFGNLIKRVSEPHSSYGASDLHRAAERLTRGSDLLPYLTQAQSGLWTVRSDEDPGTRLGAGEYRLILQVLCRHAAIVVVDLGTGMREPAFLAIAEAADALVVVAEPAGDAIESAVDAIDWVSQRTPDKSPACHVVVNATRPGSPAVDLDELTAASELYVDQVLQVPHDTHLAAGGVSRWTLLSDRTQDAYLRLAAAIMTLLPRQEAAAQPPGGDAEPAPVPANFPERTLT